MVDVAPAAKAIVRVIDPFVTVPSDVTVPEHALDVLFHVPPVQALKVRLDASLVELFESLVLTVNRVPVVAMLPGFLRSTYVISRPMPSFQAKLYGSLLTGAPASTMTFPQLGVVTVCCLVVLEDSFASATLFDVKSINIAKTTTVTPRTELLRPRTGSPLTIE
jgi:hypothetical protein